MTLTASAPPIDLAAGFREAMAHLCAPVTVIGALDGDRPHGTTVSAVMSLSMAPPLIAVALADTSDSLALVQRTGSFSVNVLSSLQPDIALQLARKGEDKFAGLGWQPIGGVPRLDDSALWLRCGVADVLPGGDHRIVVGEVLDVETDTEAAPLTYHRRSFGTHLPHPA